MKITQQALSGIARLGILLPLFFTIQSQAVLAETQTSYELSWINASVWQLDLYAESPEEGSVAISLIEFSVPYDDSRINQTAQSQFESDTYWFDPDGLCQISVNIDTVAQIIYVVCQRPTNSPLAGDGQVCRGRGGNTGVVLDDVHPRIGQFQLESRMIFDAFSSKLHLYELPTEKSRLIVYSIGGQSVYERSIPLGQKEMKLSLPLAKGQVYWVRLSNAHGSKTIKIQF